MQENIYVKRQEEAREEKEYYRPYYELIKKIDAVSGMQAPTPKKHPPQLEPLDEVAIDVVGNTRNQLCLLDQGEERITIDLWECISEILGYGCNLEDGNLLTKAIYLVSVEVTEFLQRYRRKRKNYYDIWYVDDNGHICINVMKTLPKSVPFDLYCFKSRWFTTDHNVKALYDHIMPYVSSTMADFVDISYYIQEKMYCSMEIGILLQESRAELNLYHSITHGFSLIFYLRCLLLYFYKQITDSESPHLADTTEWFVGNMNDDEMDLYLSFNPEE